MFDFKSVFFIAAESIGNPIVQVEMGIGNRSIGCLINGFLDNGRFIFHNGNRSNTMSNGEKSVQKALGGVFLFNQWLERLNSLGVIPVCCLKARLKADLELKPTSYKISKTVFLRAPDSARSLLAASIRYSFT